MGKEVLTPLKLDGGGCNCLQSSVSKAPSKACISVGISLTVMVNEGWGNPRSITFSWHVIMLMVIVPHMSWIILITNMVDPATQGWTCFWGASMVMQGESSPCKDLVISAKLCGGIPFCATGLPGSVFTHCVKMLGTPIPWLEAASVFTVEAMMSFDWPMPLVGPMPLALVLQFLPLLHSWGELAWGSPWIWRGWPIPNLRAHQFEHLGIGKSGEWLHPLPQFFDALCQLVWLAHQCWFS